MTFKIPESAIQAQILQYLAFKGIKAYRINAGMIKTEGGGLVKLAPKGFSDILAILPKTGQACFIECKAEGGRLTDFQRMFLEEMEKQGAIAFVAHSVEDVITSLERKLGRKI